MTLEQFRRHRRWVAGKQAREDQVVFDRTPTGREPKPYDPDPPILGIDGKPVED